MAKTISDENIRLNLIINGNDAQKELLDLEKSTREYTKTNKELSTLRTKMRLEGKKETQEYKNLSAEIKSNSTVIAQNKTRMAELQKEIGLTGLTMAQLTQKSILLKSQLKHTIPGSEAHTRYTNELRQVGSRLDELKGKAVRAKFSLSSLADGFSKYAALGATIIATGTGIILSFQKMIDYNGKLSDAMSDVRKTTGMTKEEVDDLTKSFGAFITRTGRIDLLKIAEEGGRIGILKNDIGEFVEVMNKASVALGDSFTGGVEEVASKLGKLKLLFEETKNIGVDEAYNGIGSAINELGANGVATEQNIANFATRVGSLPNALKPSISDALALGAAFEESGIEAEIAGRGYNIFLKQAASESGKFAKVMGISTEEVKKMINTNPTDFFLTFSEGLKGMNATETANTLNYLGVNAEGANKIVGAAGNNIDRFRELLKLSNDSMIDATSLTDEYNIKNNNLAATLGKVKKSMFGWFSSEGLVAWLTSSVEWFAKFIGATEDVDGKTTVWRNGLVALIKTALILTTGIFSYRTALKLATFWTESATVGTASYNLIQKATTLSTNFLAAATLLGRAAFFALTGQLAAAKSAMVAFNLVTKLSPIGLVVGLIGAATAAYFAFSESSKEATTKQSLLNNALKESSKNIEVEKQELLLLLKIARDETQSKIQRQKAIDELNKRVPEYNNNLTIESARTLEATSKLNDYIAAKEREILADILLNDWKKKVLAQKEAENTTLEENIGWLEQTWNAMKTGGQFFAMEAANARTSIKNKRELIDITKEEAALAKELYETQLRNNSASGGSGNNGPKEGDTMTENGITFVFKGGKWQKMKTFTPAGDDEEMTPEDKAIANSKKKLAEFLADFEAEQALRKEFEKLDKAQREEEEEIIKIERKFQKMAEEAGFETILAAGLEEAKQFEIDAVREKWGDKRIADKKKKDEEYEKLDKKHKDALKKAEDDLEKAKSNLMHAGLSTLGSIFGKKSALYKVMFGLEKALAVAEIIASTTKSIGLARAADYAVPVILPPGVPNPMKPVSVATMTASVLAAKLNAVAQIATVVGTTITGFEDGLYPVTRTQDGKQFNAGFGGQTTSGMVNKPTVFMAGENGPELIIDSNAYKQINPEIKYALHREIARVKGFENGYYQETTKQPAYSETSTSSDILSSSSINALMVMVKENTDLMRDLKDSGILATVSNKDLKSMKNIKDGINDYDTLRNKNKL